jgi:type II secretory pathway pseudopilin PulG
MNFINKNLGQTLVELLITIGLAAILIPTLLGAFSVLRGGRAQMDQRIKAVSYLKEAQEAMQIIQANGWTNLADGTYHPVISGTTWALSVNNETLNGDFIRQVVISNVYRDTNDNIATVSGNLDPSTKKVDITVSWNSPIASSITSTMYLTRYGNTIYTETLAATFNNGTLTNTQVTNSAGGEISLANNNRAKWCTPAFSSATIDLPDGPPVAVSAFASTTDVSVPNDVFVATAPYATSSIKMAFVNVTANTETPDPSLHGIFTLDPALYSSAGLVPSGIGIDNNFKTNDIKYYKAPSGKVYALIATNLSDKEVIAVQVNNGTGDAFQDPINKIYKYWTYFNTKIYNAAFNNPSVDAPETTNAGDNNGYESNPTRVYINDGSSAVDTNSGSNTGTNCAGTDKDKHRFYNFDFSIPTGATINGIEANLVAKADNTTGTPKICVQLSWDGGTTWTTAKTSNNLTTSLATYSLGGASDTWGRSWSDADFTNANFRVRLIDVASNISRDFSLDWLGVKVYYNGISSMANDMEPFGYGAKSIAVLGDTGYITSGGYLYTFDLSNIDTKSATSPLDQLGCRIQLDGYDCKPNTSPDLKYGAGQTGNPGTWGDTANPAHSDCSDGGGVALYADEHIYPVQVSGNKYIYVAVGAGTDPEFEVVNVTSVPDAGTSPNISSASCGRISGGASGWHVISTLDFNPNSGTEEAANSVYASSDGTRAYISSNGGVDANNDGIPDSDQFYILDTTNKNSPQFLSKWSSSGSSPPPPHQINTASSGYYNGSTANIQMHPRRSLTVLNGGRVILVGKDFVADSNDAQEYQVLNNETESTPTYCGGVNFDSGFNDLTSVSELDGDNFVYMVANTNEKQLKIIQGGADNAIYTASGVFESKTFDAESNVMFNRFFVTQNTPANTSISYQVSSEPAINNSCNSVIFNYVGPDDTINTFFTGNAEIPRDSDGSGYENPGRCFRYKAYMTSSTQTNTPTLDDFNVNYSP